MSSTANRVIKNTGYLYAKMAITMFVSLYTTRLILNALGASDFGIYNIVGGAIAMLGFLNASMASATQRFMSYAEGEGNKEKQKYIFNISVVLHAGIAVFVTVVLLVAGYFFFNGILNIPTERMGAAKVVYLSLIISTLLTVMNVPYDAVMNAHENMRYYALVGILESFLKLAVAFACVYASGDKLIVYGVLMACIPLFTLSIMKVYCHKHYDECVIKPRKYWNRGLMKEMTSFAGWSFVGSMGSIVGNYGVGIVLNNFFGTILNAALGIANQLNGMLLFFSNSMLKALNPVIVKKLGEGEQKSMLRFSYSGCRFSFILFTVFCIPCFVEAPFVLKVWLKDYPDWAVLFVRYQIARTLLEQLFVVLGTTLNATGKIKEINIATLFVMLMPLLLLTVIFYCGASPAWYYPVIIIDMVFFGSIIRLYLCRKYCGVSIGHFSKSVILPCVAVAVPVFCVGWVIQTFMEADVTRFMVNTFVMILLLCVLSFFMLSDDEKEIIRSVTTSVLRRIK